MDLGSKGWSCPFNKQIVIINPLWILASLQAASWNGFNGPRNMAVICRSETSICS